MPLVKVEIIKGKTPDYKKQLLQCIHEALMLSLGIPDDDRFQRLYELEKDGFEYSNTKTDKFTLIELTFFPGRSKEMKRLAIRQITQILSDRLGIQPSDIFIIIYEPPLDNWGMRGEQASELNIAYKK